LPPFGACLLGSFNLVEYLDSGHSKLGNEQGYGLRKFDYALLAQDVRTAVRAMDMVIDQASYPLEQQRVQAVNTRRMGLGVTGLANALEALGHEYASPDFMREMAIILTHIRDHAYRESVQMAKELEQFPLFSVDRVERLMQRGTSFYSTLPWDIRDAILRHGIRNSHLLSIAPCGTISLCADNVSSGVEPVFDYEVKRKLNAPTGMEEHTLQDYGAKFLGVHGKVAAQVTAEEHLRVLCCAQQYVDSSVSKTCNVPSHTSWQEFEQLYSDAWKAGCKGLTTFQDGGSRVGILKSSRPETSSCTVDPRTGRRECE